MTCHSGQGEPSKEGLLVWNEVYAIIGAAIEVHRILGQGFLEAVYQDALQIEFRGRGIPFERKKVLPVRYKDCVLDTEYVADLVCFGQIIVELKVAEALNDKHEAQVLNYLRATGLRVGLLINFGSRGRLDWRRYIL